MSSEKNAQKNLSPKCDHCGKETDELYTCPRCEDQCCNNCCAGKNVVCFRCEEEPDDDE